MRYGLLAPEILTAGLAIIVLMAGLVLPQRGKKAVGLVSVIGLLAILVYQVIIFRQTTVLFEGIYLVDGYSNFFHILFLCAALLVFAMAGGYTKFFGKRKTEWYSFMLFATLGMMIMAGAGDLLTVYIGLELMTISFYILSAYLLNDRLSGEAGLKYLILGAVSSAILLLGMSLVYAAAGTTVFTAILGKVTSGSGLSPILVGGIVLIIAGFGFKISTVPFHMWAPDIYQGAPTPVTAHLAIASKAAGFAALVRIFMTAFPELPFDWHLVIALLAALTMVVGNLIALSQKNVKRLLAYSSIAQAGYIVVGLAAGNSYGLKGVLFYALIYVFSNAGAFAVTTLVEVDTGSTDLRSFDGLARRSPMLAAIMTVCLLSLAGIPPMAGFAGKFYLFSGAVQSGYLWLALIGLIMSMVSVFYYLNVAKAMYIGDTVKEGDLEVPMAARCALWICLAATIFIGCYPGPLSNLTQMAVIALLH